MTERIPAFLSLLLLLAMETDSHAAPQRSVEDGCGRLRAIVLSQVSVLQAESREPALLREANGQPAIADPPHYCTDTAAATTAAFAAAMRAKGIAVSWSDDAREFCSSRSLSQCYPHPVFSNLAAARPPGFLHGTWEAVRSAVTGSMPYGVASDMAVFDQNGLEQSIRRGAHREHQPIIRSISDLPQE